jgi:hypothetical protein
MRQQVTPRRVLRETSGRQEDRVSCQKCHREGEITGTWWGKQGPELIGFICRACGEDWTIRIEDAEPWMLTAAGMADLRRAEKGARFVA